MRPLRLTMQAFGSYGKRTVIDAQTDHAGVRLLREADGH